MPRIEPKSIEQAHPSAREELERQIAAHGRVTNMKCTLAHSPIALEAYMRWYPLHDEVVTFLGKRRTMLFVHAISSATDCLICSTFFRRLLQESGEDPDRLSLDALDEIVVAYGRQLVREPNGVSAALFAQLREHWTPAQIVSLTALGGLMIATNVFNNALEVELDDYLAPYRKEAGTTGPAFERSGP